MKKIKVLICIVLSVLLLGSTVSAAQVQSTPYWGYEYNNENKSVPAPVGYENDTVVHDYDIKLSMELGTAVNAYYDGTDTEAQFALIQTDRQIIKMDINYNVVAYYTLPDCGTYTDIAHNVENGYIFAVRGGVAYVYNTNGNFVKVLSAPAVAGLKPTRIEHALLDGESVFIAVSGSNAVVFDGFGEYVSTFSFDMPIFDVCYNVSASTVTFLFADKIIDYTNDTAHSISHGFSSSARLASGFSEEEYYVLDGNTVYLVNTFEETAELVAGTVGALAVNYNADLEKLNILFSDDSLNVAFYNSDLAVEKQMSGFGIRFDSAADMFYDDKDSIYILDSGNGRILKADTGLNAISEIYESFLTDTEKLSIVGAQGMWIDGERLLIADTEHERVVVSDLDGNVKKVLLKPEKLTGLTAPFKVSKILTDRNGRIYCIASTVNLGAFVFSKDYEYQNFFGSNDVLTTAEAIYNYFIKRFLNKEQKAALKSNTPVNLSNFDIDPDGFIYVVTKTDQKLINNTFSGLIRKINYISSDIWETEDDVPLFGDFEWDRESKVTNTSFSDIDISSDGWVNALDSARGKVFQYSPEGQLITVFGGIGEQNGLLNSPSAIESIADKVYVLDSYNRTITIYMPTEYVSALHDAFINMDTASLEQATKKWNRVLSLNSNNMYAYYGLGIAYENAGMYEKAMENFKLADAKAQYSKAFKEYRKTYIGDHILIFAVIIIAGIAALAFVIRKLSRMFIVPESGAFAPIETRKGMPLYVLFHPADGFAQFRTRKMNSTVMALAIALAFFLIKILEFFKTGFIFNANKPINYSLFSTFVGTLLIYILFVVSNLAIASFMDGKGTLKHILALTSYSMIPFLTVTLINIGISNILLLDEQVLMSILTVIGTLWSLLLLIIGSIQIHEYSFGKTLLSLILTVVGMLVMSVLGILLFSLVQELLSFLKAVIYELSLR